MLDENTPAYGNRNRFEVTRNSSIFRGDLANDSSIKTTGHIGTHIDMPYHFFDDGQTIEEFDANFFRFENILVVDFAPKNIIIKDDLVQLLEKISEKSKYEILIVKTGICHKRNTKEFWETNYGFAPEVAAYLREYFPNIRVFGFDSISVSSFTERMLGREAHKAFLNPDSPILLMEDMDLSQVNNKIKFKNITIAPLRIAKCDGLPCTVIAEVY